MSKVCETLVWANGGITIVATCPCASGAQTLVNGRVSLPISRAKVCTAAWATMAIQGALVQLDLPQPMPLPKQRHLSTHAFTPILPYWFWKETKNITCIKMQSLCLSENLGSDESSTVTQINENWMMGHPMGDWFEMCLQLIRSVLSFVCNNCNSGRVKAENGWGNDLLTAMIWKKGWGKSMIGGCDLVEWARCWRD